MEIYTPIETDGRVCNAQCNTSKINQEKALVRPPVQDFCSSDLGMVPVRDMNTETARQMPEDLPALSDAVKAFVWSWVTLTYFSLKTSPKDGKINQKTWSWSGVCSHV